MRYISTRGNAPALTFEEAMMTGLASDGGLYLPEGYPQLTEAEIADLAFLPYEDVALKIVQPFIGDAFTQDELRDMIAAAYGTFNHTARAPLVQLASNHFLLELFHGPTLAFKDFAMQLIGQLFQASLKRSGKRITIVGATSGDTGSAAMMAFAGLENVDVYILYPDGRVSEVQRRQMSTPEASNVHAVAVEGDFDDCQAALKAMFRDEAFRTEVGLAGVNSINWARVLAQVVYYFTSATALGAPYRDVSFTVPTGNFGDIFAGYVAKRMGLPIQDLVIATNQNDILHRTLTTGVQEKAQLHASISPSMDIQVSSNFERMLFEAYSRDANVIVGHMAELDGNGRYEISQGAIDALRETFKSGRVSEGETLAKMAAAFAETGELLCPHSAVGVAVAEAHLSEVPMITLATAHPAKFPDAVKQATGVYPDLPAHMAGIFEKPERITHKPNDVEALKAMIREVRSA